jgi:hypothetical protein
MKEVGKTWSLAGVPLIVEADSMNKPNLRYSEHAVLDSVETVIMLYGKSHHTREISGVLWSGLASIKNFVGSGWVAFISDQGDEGNYFINDLGVETLHDVKRDVPVYRITVSMRRQI